MVKTDDAKGEAGAWATHARAAAGPTLRATLSIPMVRFGAGGHRLGRLAAFAAAWVTALLAVGTITVVHPTLWRDALVYWSAWHAPLYAGGFVYPPAGAFLSAPAAFLSWPAFALVWLAVLAAAGVWLLWPLPLRLRLPLTLVLFATLTWGNAATLLAIPLALAPRYPVLWTLLAWTKVTPAVAAVSLVRQRRWRDVALLTAVCGLVGVSVLVLAPGALGAWLTQLRAHPEVPQLGFLPDPGLPVRLAVAAAIAWWGASRPWTLAIAAAVATPDLTLATLGLLAAVPRLRRRRYG